jgi:GNAT superfamily N-acetyltransferase
MELVAVSPGDDHAFAEWFAVYRACQHHDFPDEPHGTLAEQRALHLSCAESDAPVRTVLVGAVDDGAVVGVLRVDLPQCDNTHRVDVELLVRPDQRRRGAGSMLLGEACRLARQHGRTTVLGDVGLPVGQEAGHAFATQAGASCEQTDVRRVLHLPADPARLAALDQEARSHSTGYEVVLWRDHVPAVHLDDRARLEQRMSTDAPLGGLDWREESWDGARFRRHEEQQAALGRIVLSAGAVHDGRLVAFTDLGVLRARPELAHQWNTLVLREHRGHRLGLLVKLAGLRALAAQVPEVRRIATWNAEENAPMIAVNEALGFRVAGGSTAWSLVL